MSFELYKKLDFVVGKTYVSRAGENVRVLATDRNCPDQPIVVMKLDSGIVYFVNWYGMRNSNCHTSHDIVGVPKIKKDVFVNVYVEKNGVVTLHKHLNLADAEATLGRFDQNKAYAKTHKITIEYEE